MGRDAAAVLAVVNLLILLANIGVLALGIKLYTEVFKEGRFESRAKRLGGPKI